MPICINIGYCGEKLNKLSADLSAIFVEDYADSTDYIITKARNKKNTKYEKK